MIDIQEERYQRVVETDRAFQLTFAQLEQTTPVM
jgi:hypothetical protein